MEQRRYLATRPIWRWSLFWKWQARIGATPIGPEREFMLDALADLPAEAQLSINDFREYTCCDRYGISPVHRERSGLRFGNASDFIPWHTIRR